MILTQPDLQPPRSWRDTAGPGQRGPAHGEQPRQPQGVLLPAPVRFTAPGRLRLPGSPAPESLAEHRARWGTGGTHAATRRGVTLVANATDPDPGSARDLALLQVRPHLVLDGLQRAAAGHGAERVVVWLQDGAAGARHALARALTERRLAGLAELPVAVETGPTRYLTGEPSAIVRALDGGPPLPAVRRAPAPPGRSGRPEIIIEDLVTLATIAVRARGGDQAQAPGTLITLAGPDTLTVVEVPAGRTLAQVLSHGEPGRPGTAGTPGAVLVGGVRGRWLPWQDAADLPLGALDGVRGPRLGAGVLAVLPQGACGLTATADVAAWLAASSARQCGPCRNGTPELAALLRRIALGGIQYGDATGIARLGGFLRGRGACTLPDGAANLAASAAAVFAADLAAHLAGRPCAMAGLAVPWLALPEPPAPLPVPVVPVGRPARRPRSTS